jgi:intein/homing endonuclease
MESEFAKTIFKQKYALTPDQTWEDKCKDVSAHLTMGIGYKEMLARKFIPGGRYLYSAGRPKRFLTNCYCLDVEDTRESWSQLLRDSSACLMSGGGIGVNYSKIRPEGSVLTGTGGIATGPIALMQIVNEAARWIVQGGSRRCLPANTLVTMADYTKKQIKDVVVGDSVLTRFGPRQVSNTFFQGTQTVYEITTEHGSVRATANHRFLAANRYREVSWREVDRLQIGGKLYFYPTPDTRREGTKATTRETEHAYLLGFYCGNGCAYSSNRTYEMTLQIADRWKTDAQIELLNRAMLDNYEIMGKRRQGHGACTELRFRSIKLVPIFQAIKAPNTPPNIPDWIRQGSIAIRSAFLAGWMDADGSYTQDSWRLSNKWKCTIDELVELFSGLGLQTAIQSTSSCYEVRVCSHQRTLFLQLLGPYLHKLPQHEIFKKTAEIPSKILSITRLEEQESTYDIEVEEVHEFLADDFVSHNSAVFSTLSWDHADIHKFLESKIRTPEQWARKAADWNEPLPLDMTNISVQYQEDFFDLLDAGDENAWKLWLKHAEISFKHSDPGWFFPTKGEVLTNACVSGDTKILTRKGNIPISELVDRSVDVWNGEQWSAVTPVITGYNRPAVKITLSNGRTLTCTHNHKFHIVTGYGRSVPKTEEVEAVNLIAGQRLLHLELPTIIEGEKYDNMYQQGFKAAEGMEGYDYTLVYAPKFMCLRRLGKSRDYSPTAAHTRITFAKDLREKFFVPIRGDLPSKLDWLAGYLDGDGTELKEGGCQCASTNLVFLQQLQEMLTTIGVDSKVQGAKKAGKYLMPNGKGGNSEYECQTCYRLCIGAVQMQSLKSLGLHCERLKFNKTPNRDATKYATVLSVEDAGTIDVTYCFTEPIAHRGIFNGILTGQCSEFRSSRNMDSCNLGTVFLPHCTNLDDFCEVVWEATGALMAGRLTGDSATKESAQIGKEDNRIGLGLGGIAEWLHQRGQGFEVSGELRQYLEAYVNVTEEASRFWAKHLGVNVPKALRAIAPTGTISLIAQTTGGIEPIFCKAYKRRYLKGNTWLHQYVIDPAVQRLLARGIAPEAIPDAYDVSFEDRVRFQADIQDYVDMAISSTVNMGAWGSEGNNFSNVEEKARVVAKYARRLRGLTTYADGSIPGQPLERVELAYALGKEGTVFEGKEDSCKGGICGM